MIQTRLVVDASVVIKWIAPEEGSIQAQQLRGSFRLIAPELIYAECANIVWKKVRRGNIPASEAVQAIGILASVDVETLPLGPLAAIAMEISTRLDHPAYDCFYLALAIVEDSRMVTADTRFLRVLEQEPNRDLLTYCAALHGFQP